MAIVQSGDFHHEANWQAPTDDEENFVAMVAVMLAAGWTAIAKSDGTTATTSATPNTSSDWNNQDAWQHLRDPGGARDVSIQRGLAGNQVRIYMSQAGDPMTGGDATNAPTPTGTSAQILGTSGTYATSVWDPTVVNDRIHFWADEVGRGTTGDVYGFGFCVRTATTGTGREFFWVMPIITEADGTSGDEDTEPWVYFHGTSTVTGSSIGGWYKAGLSGESFVSANGMSGDYTTDEMGLNPYTGQYDAASIRVSDITGGVPQRKGTIDPAVAYWKGASTHNTYDTYNLATEGESKIVFDIIAVPWPHNVAPVP